MTDRDDSADLVTGYGLVDAATCLAEQPILFEDLTALLEMGALQLPDRAVRPVVVRAA
jgi:hypothetical protein